MLWYINETYKNKWSRTILGNKIKMKSYELRLIEHHDNCIISNDNPLLDEIFNSKLAIGFIDKNKIILCPDILFIFILLRQIQVYRFILYRI